MKRRYNFKPITPTNIILKHKQSNTLLEVMGYYDIIGFFPNCKGMNMVIILKEKEDGRNETT